MGSNPPAPASALQNTMQYAISFVVGRFLISLLELVLCCVFCVCVVVFFVGFFHFFFFFFLFIPFFSGGGGGGGVSFCCFLFCFVQQYC